MNDCRLTEQVLDAVSRYHMLDGVSTLLTALSGGSDSTALLLALVPVGAVPLWEFATYWPDRLWSCGLHWYPFLLIAPGACLAIAAAASALERNRAGRALNRAAGFVGGYTFEIYLTHLCLPRLPAPIFLLCTALCTALLAGVSRLLRRVLESRQTEGAAL